MMRKGKSSLDALNSLPVAYTACLFRIQLPRHSHGPLSGRIHVRDGRRLVVLVRLARRYGKRFVSFSHLEAIAAAVLER